MAEPLAPPLAVDPAIPTSPAPPAGPDLPASPDFPASPDLPVIPPDEPVAWRDAFLDELESVTPALSPADHAAVVSAVDGAVGVVEQARQPANRLNRVTTVIVSIALGVTWVGSGVLGGFWADGGFWNHTWAALLALGLYTTGVFVYGRGLITVPVFKRRVLATVLWAGWLALAYVPPRTSWAPGWLRDGFVHIGLSASAITYTGFWASMVALAVPFGFVYQAVARRIRHRLPEESLIDGLTDFFVNMPAPGTVDELPVRRNTLTQLEKLALDFERWWPHRIRTGFPVVDSKAQDWARGVASRVRAPQLGLLVGQHNRADLGPFLSQVIADLVLRHDLGSIEDFDVAAERITWWLKVRRSAFAGFLFLLGVLLLVAAAWQPGLPDLLTAHGWTNLATTFTWGDNLRAGALAGGFTTLSLFARLITPDHASTFPDPLRRLGNRR